MNFGNEEFLWPKGFERGKHNLKANSGPNISVIRRSAFAASGGFDESIRFGHEDWDFWLAMAKSGHWGHTLPEFLEWYRKHEGSRYDRSWVHDRRMPNSKPIWSEKYADLESRFPDPKFKPPEPYEAIPTGLPFTNRLAKAEAEQRILFLVPWLVTGAPTRSIRDWIEGLIAGGYRVSVCATLQSDHPWLHDFARLTPDVFILPNFLRLPTIRAFCSI